MQSRNIIIIFAVAVLLLMGWLGFTYLSQTPPAEEAVTAQSGAQNTPDTLSGTIAVFNNAAYDGEYSIQFTPDASSLAKLPRALPDYSNNAFVVSNGETYLSQLCGDKCPTPPVIDDNSRSGNPVTQHSVVVKVVGINFDQNNSGKGGTGPTITVSDITVVR